MGRAERPLDPDLVTNVQPVHDMAAGRPARHVADVEFQHGPVVRPVGHRIVAGRLAGERNARVLPGRKHVGPAGGDAQAHTADVVRCRFDRLDAADHLAPRMHDRLVGLQPGYFAGLPRHRAAGQDQSRCALRLGQGEVGIGRQLDIAGQQARFAGAAVAGLAAMRIVGTLAQRRRQDRLAGLHRDRLVVLTDADLHAHARHTPPRGK